MHFSLFLIKLFASKPKREQIMSCCACWISTYLCCSWLPCFPPLSKCCITYADPKKLISLGKECRDSDSEETRLLAYRFFQQAANFGYLFQLGNPDPDGMYELARLIKDRGAGTEVRKILSIRDGRIGPNQYYVGELFGRHRLASYFMRGAARAGHAEALKKEASYMEEANDEARREQEYRNVTMQWERDRKKEAEEAEWATYLANYRATYGQSDKLNEVKKTVDGINAAVDEMKYKLEEAEKTKQAQLVHSLTTPESPSDPI